MTLDHVGEVPSGGNFARVVRKRGPNLEQHWKPGPDREGEGRLGGAGCGESGSAVPSQAGAKQAPADDGWVGVDPSIVKCDSIATIGAVSQAVSGNVIEVRPGGRVPADSKIIEGESTIDESAVTGESMPKRKSAGDSLYAGSINSDHLIRLSVEKDASDNMIARILTMVEDAEASKAPTARFIDKFSRYYTPGVIMVSALIAFIPPVFFDAQLIEWIYKGLAILLIGGPCALVLSTPAAITSGISAGARLIVIRLTGKSN